MAEQAEKTILLVDDEEVLVLAIKLRLQSKGYRVLVASDGQQALEQITTDRPDLVLLDVRMPVMDGYTCLRALNSRYGRCEIPVIILTARERLQDLFELEGIEDYIIKPFETEDLLMRVAQVFKRRAEGRRPS